MDSSHFFSFDYRGEGPTDFTADKVADTLVKMAGGAPLPGVLGLAQGVAATWTQPMSGPGWLRAARCSLMTAGALLAYRKEKNPKATEVRSDKAADYVKALGLTPADELDDIRGLAYSYLSRQTSYVDRKLPGADSRPVRVFSCGLHVIFYDERELEDCTSGRYAPSKLYRTPGDTSRVLEAVRNAAWASASGDIEFTCRSGRYGDVSYSVGPMSPSGDFVDRPANGEAAVLSELAVRCRKFNARGLRRRILFYGPPGTGKTTLARKLAVAVGDGRALRMDPTAVSRTSNRSMMTMIDLLQPTVVMLDDLDRAGGVDGMLSLIEETQSVPVIVASVNAIGQLDPALLRPGRFDEVVQVDPPGASWRYEIMKHYAEVFGLDPSVDIRAQSKDPTDGFSPAELKELIQVAAVVGPEVLEVELHRLRMQHALYSGDAVDSFLRNRRAGSVEAVPTKA